LFSGETYYFLKLHSEQNKYMLLRSWQKYHREYTLVRTKSKWALFLNRHILELFSSSQ